MNPVKWYMSSFFSIMGQVQMSRFILQLQNMSIWNGLSKDLGTLHGNWNSWPSSKGLNIFVMPGAYLPGALIKAWETKNL